MDKSDNRFYREVGPYQCIKPACPADCSMCNYAAPSSKLVTSCGVPDGWQIESGEGGFVDAKWICVRNIKSQLGQDFWEDDNPFMYAFLSELLNGAAK